MALTTIDPPQELCTRKKALKVSWLKLIELGLKSLETGPQYVERIHELEKSTATFRNEYYFLKKKYLELEQKLELKIAERGE